MTSLPTLAAAAALVASEPAPILFLDTCSVRDILRVPLRGAGRKLLTSDDLGAAQDLLRDGTATPRRVWLVSVPLVHQEFDKGVVHAGRELSDYLEDLDDKVTHARAAWARFFPGSPALRPTDHFSVREMPQKLRQLASDLLEASLMLSEDNDCLTRARQRSIHGRAPAAQGKSSREDCEIVEHYLELSRLLKRRGFAAKRVFVSSNSKDYRPTGRDRDPELEAEFADADLMFAGAFSWAVGLLR